MIEERMAVLETKVKILEDQNTEVLKQLQEIKESLSKYKGFVGGIVFLGSCFYYMLTFSKEWLLKKLGL